MRDQLEGILRELYEVRDRIKNADELETFRVKFLGRKGILREFAQSFKDATEEEKRTIGNHFNKVKQEVEDTLADLTEKFKKRERVRFDFTYPGKTPLVGYRHLMSLELERVKDIFASLGFSSYGGYEIVTEYENFDSLNIPKNHPARDMWDTLWIDQKEKEEDQTETEKTKYLFRTHTSAYQVKLLKEQGVPLRAIIPGKVFRHEATDRTHDFEFHQIEGLVIDEGANIAELKYVLESFYRAYFGKDLKIRLRPGYFPFVEPGLEVDLGCIFCKGKGCLTCKKTGFIEVAGAGMVHPSVLQESGIDPDSHYGYAFGLGLGRAVMLKYGISDIRLLHSADFRFIEQFR